MTADCRWVPVSLALHEPRSAQWRCLDCDRRWPWPITALNVESETDDHSHTARSCSC